MNIKITLELEEGTLIKDFTNLKTAVSYLNDLVYTLPQKDEEALKLLQKAYSDTVDELRKEA